MKRRAFTLVELLVVVGVLAVCVVLFMPRINPARGNARKSACQNNLKQIVLGFKQYSNDFDERAPLVVVTNGSALGVPPYGWADALQPYIKNTQVYQCPSDTNQSEDDPRKPNYCDYWYNANFIKIRNHRAFGGVDVIHVGPGPFSHEQIIIFGEGGNTSGTPTGDARYNQCGDGTSVAGQRSVCASSPPGVATFPAAQIHLDGSNFAFVDGHVKWLRGNAPTRSTQVLNNGFTPTTMGEASSKAKVTFSLLSR